ncbi:MAG: phosphate-starvation-inducible PsiE family protein [Methylococcales bacterium]|nr:phosphate-starvation-inducible PsiE family protein [Methylococcales bacterium]MDD5633120.1 phosphate-starvation-inducible PsiE family protein [Methylococcales bacterium]
MTIRKIVQNQWLNFIKQLLALTWYQRFEHLVALILTILVSLIMLVAMYRLSAGIIHDLLFGFLNPLEHEVFQSLFGEIMTLLIAMEFNHTIHLVAMRKQNIIQVKTVLLIAILALARKVIIMDLHQITSGQIEALAAITLALGIVYWLMRERDDRLSDLESN